MELTQIRYFIMVNETGSFTRAAEFCGVSQPALTKAIHKLEAELGGPLFHREGKRVLRSPLGEAMTPLLTQIWEQTQAAERTAENFRLLERVPVRLGVLTSIGPRRLADPLGRYKQSFPRVDLEVHQGSVDELLRALDNGSLDLAIIAHAEAATTASTEELFHTVHLYTEGYVAVFQAGHEFERLTQVRLRDIDKRPYVDRLACELRELVVAACREHDVELYAAFRSEREDWIQSMVAAGIGFALMPEGSVTHPELLMRPLVDPPLRRSIDLLRPRGRQLPRAVLGLHAALTGQQHR